MREILFRGKWTRNGKWIEGFYARIHDGKGNVSHRIYPGYAESDCGDFYPENFEVDPSTVGQYTGLTDKNGKKIFEGDIVSTGKMIHQVRFRYGAFELLRGAATVSMYAMIGTDVTYEVIGNIHDNPELLEGNG